MTKQEFLDELKAKLNGLPETEITKSLDYYQEMIDERIDDGLSEEEAVEAMGTVEEAVNQILTEIPLPKIVVNKVKPKQKSKGGRLALLIIALVLTCWFWLPISIAIIAVFLCVYICFWVVIIVLYAVDLAFAAGGLGGVLLGIFFIITGHVGTGLGFIGAGLFLIGSSVMLFIPFTKLAKLLVKASRKFVLWIKKLLTKKKDNTENIEIEDKEVDANAEEK